MRTSHGPAHARPFAGAADAAAAAIGAARYLHAPRDSTRPARQQWKPGHETEPGATPISPPPSRMRGSRGSGSRNDRNPGDGRPSFTASTGLQTLDPGLRRGSGKDPASWTSPETRLRLGFKHGVTSNRCPPTRHNDTHLPASLADARVQGTGPRNDRKPRDGRLSFTASTGLQTLDPGLRRGSGTLPPLVGDDRQDFGLHVGRRTSL